MRKRKTAAVAVVMTGALALVACSSRASTSTAAAAAPTVNNTAASGAPIKLGLLTSMTGVSSSSFNTVYQGVEARIGLQNAEGGVDGHKLTYVVADDTSSGPGAVAAAQQLIEQDHVYGIMDASAFFSAAAETTTQAGIPVTGVSIDAGPEWSNKSETNIFDAYGYGNFSLVSTTYPQFFKMKGATKVAAIGYGDSPSSAMNAEAVAAGSQKEGLQAFYDNSLPFGSTDVGPLVQKIKAEGANAIYLSTVQSTGYAMAQALKQAGVKYKALVLATGYGQDVISDAATRDAATGIDFANIFAPIEANTAATQKFEAAMQKYAGVSGIPSWGAYVGWLTTDLMIYGLEQAGPEASSQQFITKLRASTWNGAGLETPTDFSDIKPTPGGQDQGRCLYFIRFNGSTFVPEQGASPLCGSIINGVTISTPS
jgi:ABC-type branched-subunit amino acid transport system substrate-binding protein